MEVLKKIIRPGDIVVPDDYTNFYNILTFFDKGLHFTVPGLSEKIEESKFLNKVGDFFIENWKFLLLFFTAFSGVSLFILRETTIHGINLKISWLKKEESIMVRSYMGPPIFI